MTLAFKHGMVFVCLFIVVDKIVQLASRADWFTQIAKD